MTFNFLNKVLNNKILNNPSSLKAKRSKAKRHDFCLKLNAEQFSNIRNSIINKGFIDDSVSSKNFINAFSGRAIENKIIWKGGNYRLSFFVKELNSRNCFPKKLYDGIWEIIADIFEKENGSNFELSELAHSSPSKGLDYTSVKDIVDEIVDYLKPDLED